MCRVVGFVPARVHAVAVAGVGCAGFLDDVRFVCPCAGICLLAQIVGPLSSSVVEKLAVPSGQVLVGGILAGGLRLFDPTVL